MPLKARNQIKTIKGAGDLSLKADPGESFLVKRILVFAEAAPFLTIKIEKTTVAYFRVDYSYGNHLMPPTARSFDFGQTFFYPENLLDLLTRLGIFKGYPVAEGETILIQGTTLATDFKSVIYDIYDGEDIKATDPNGSKSLEYMLINYGDTGAIIDTPGDNLYDNPLNPKEFPSFPFGADVPAKHQITLHGICGSEVYTAGAGPTLNIHSTYLKLLKDREVLFDEDRNGLLFDHSKAAPVAPGTYYGGGVSVIGAFSHTDPRPPLIFTEPLLFEAGDELNIYMSVLEPAGASNIPIINQTIALIETVKRLTGAA